MEKKERQKDDKMWQTLKESGLKGGRKIGKTEHGKKKKKVKPFPNAILAHSHCYWSTPHPLERIQTLQRHCNEWITPAGFNKWPEKSTLIRRRDHHITWHTDYTGMLMEHGNGNSEAVIQHKATWGKIKWEQEWAETAADSQKQMEGLRDSLTNKTFKTKMKSKKWNYQHPILLLLLRSSPCSFHIEKASHFENRQTQKKKKKKTGPNR